MPRTQRHPRADPETPADVKPVRWSTLAPEIIAAHKQGEHVAIIGPTGRGKSTLALSLLNARADMRGASVVAFGTKLRDDTLEDLGWPIIQKWPPDFDHRVKKRVILWPDYGRSSSKKDRDRKRAIFEEALDEILEEGDWTVYVDEAIYLTEQLSMRHQLDEFWNAARSAGVTLVASSQGITWVPRPMLSQQSWIFGFRQTDAEDRKDLARLMGNTARFFPVLSRLGTHEFVLVRTLSEEAYVSKVGT